MNWLFPLYLAGAAAVIAPILLHLRRRPPQDRVEFSSLLFLDAQTPVPVSKRRLENWLLLLLRCLALILLALMFSRPFVQGDAAVSPSASSATLILLDRSASMRREDLWQRAVAEAARVIKEAKLTDRIALAVFDRELKTVWTFEEDHTTPVSRATTTQARLAALKPAWGGTHLDRALIAAVPSFDSSTATLKKRILLISDLQEGARLDSLRTLAWPAELTLQVHRLDPATNDNLSLALAATDAADAPPAATAATLGGSTSAPFAPAASLIRVRLSNTRDSALRDFTLAWEQAPASESITAQIPPGASRILTAPPNSTNATLLVMTGDRQDFDNRLFIAPPQPRTVRLHFLGDSATRDQAASPLYYLSRALQATPTLAPQLTADEGLPAQKPDIVFISGTPPAAAAHAELRDFLSQGGFLVHVIQSPADAALLQALTGTQGISIADGVDEDYCMLAEVKTDHPLLRPFADPRLRDFTKLRFWHHRHLQGLAGAADASAGTAERAAAIPGFETLATFDNGHPAILSARVGKGTLIVMASGWHPADSQLALSTKFVPLLFGWLSAAGFRHDPASSLLVGDALPLDAAQAHTITDPENKTHTVAAGQSFTATQAGLYKVQTTAHTQTIAVNLPPDESRVLPLDPQKLASYGVKLAAAADAVGAADPAEQQRLTATDAEQRQQVWWWILVVLLAVLLLETWFAGRGRQTAPQAA